MNRSAENNLGFRKLRIGRMNRKTRNRLISAWPGHHVAPNAISLSLSVSRLILSRSGRFHEEVDIRSRLRVSFISEWMHARSSWMNDAQRLLRCTWIADRSMLSSVASRTSSCRHVEFAANRNIYVALSTVTRRYAIVWSIGRTRSLRVYFQFAPFASNQSINISRIVLSFGAHKITDFLKKYVPLVLDEKKFSENKRKRIIISFSGISRFLLLFVSTTRLARESSACSSLTLSRYRGRIWFKRK